MPKYTAPLNIQFDDGTSLEEFRTKTNAALDTLNSQWVKLLESLDANRLASIESELAKLDQLANQVAALETVDPAIAAAMQESITSLEAKVTQLETDIQEAQNMIAVIAGTPVSPPQPSVLHDPATYVALLEDWDPTKTGGGTWTRTDGIRDLNNVARQLNELQTGGATGMVNQTMSVVSEQLQIAIGATDAGDGNGGTLYFQFYTKDPNYSYPGGYIQSFILENDWSTSINALRFRMMCDSNITVWGSPGAHTLGTYVRDHDDADGAYQGAHYYNRFANDFHANKWVWVELNPQPQTKVGTTGNSVWPWEPELVANGGNEDEYYFDGMSRFYLALGPDNQQAAYANTTFLFDDFTFLIKDNLPIYSRTGVADGPLGTVQVGYVANVTVQHDGTGYELTWACPKHSPAITYDIYRSATSMTINGIGVGTLVASGAATSPASAYTNARYTTGALTDESQYWAIKPQGYDNFYEIYYENVNS